MQGEKDFFVQKEKELGVSLNDTQVRAVLHTDGPLLILASPGSGKTTTVIMKIGYLIKEKGLSPARIKAVTFSRASARDMQERFKRFFPNLPPIDFSTIHSFAFQVVREHFRKTNTAYQIIEGDTDLTEREKSISANQSLHKKQILREIFKSVVRENITEDQMDELTTYISYVKNKMIPPEKWSLVKVDVPEAHQILLEYELFKESGTNVRLLDYDDMLTLGNEILEDRETLQRYQQRYDYVLTDESQDTSLIQHVIIEKLVQEHNNLCVVADDDQSIYSWRGAEPSYLLNFKKVYSQAVILFMEQNYRSSQDIVLVANEFIKRNKKRYDKNMFTNNPLVEPIKIRTFKDFESQAPYVVEQIRKIENLSEVAVLYRNNWSSIALMNHLDRANIPFFMKDADNRFFSHWVVQDILNFMRMTYTDKRLDIFEKIHMKMNGYITKQQVAELRQVNNNESVFDNLLKFVHVQDYQIKFITESKETLGQMRGMPPRYAIQVIRERLGYEKALEKMCERLGFRKDYLMGILNTLEEIADSLETMSEFASRLKYLALILKTSKTRKGQNVVTLSTFHSSKGLEFEHVFMIDLIDGVVPSSNESGIADLMEEATRLFYVAMTRAKRHLELIDYRERDKKYVRQSPFVVAVRKIINEMQERQRKIANEAQKRRVTTVNIPPNPNAIRTKEELRQGQTVRHIVLGSGRIVAVNESVVRIEFESEVKELVIGICLEKGLLEPV